MNFLLSMNNGVRVGMMNFTKLKARNKVFAKVRLAESFCLLFKKVQQGRSPYIVL